MWLWSCSRVVKFIYKINHHCEKKEGKVKHWSFTTARNTEMTERAYYVETEDRLQEAWRAGGGRSVEHWLNNLKKV